MRIETLSISDFRVITELELNASSGLNIIWGDNGAGKTSVLEALYFASRGRSFRHREAGPFIRTGSKRSRVVVSILDEMQHRHVLGVERGNRDQTVRYDGKQLSRRSEQVRALAVQLLTPNSHILIEGPPEFRRRYLDMGLFHVEHHYQGWYLDYQRVLRQRNASLRSQPSVIRAWDEQIEPLALKLHSARQDYLCDLVGASKKVLNRLAPDLSLSLVYRPGWDITNGLADQLAHRMDIDRKLGFTGIGPHRADIVIRVENADAAKRLSRGQQKIVVLGLLLGQAVTLKDKSGQKPILLLDDLPAELDRTHRHRVISELQALDVQAFITTVDADSLPVESEWGLFHVEQGGQLAS